MHNYANPLLVTRHLLLQVLSALATTAILAYLDTPVELFAVPLQTPDTQPGGHLHVESVQLSAIEHFLASSPS